MFMDDNVDIIHKSIIYSYNNIIFMLNSSLIYCLFYTFRLSLLKLSNSASLMFI